MKGGDQEAFDNLVSKLPTSLASKTGSWRDGYSIQMTDEDEFTAFLSLDQRFAY